MKRFKMFSLVLGFFGCAILTLTSHILLSPSQQRQVPHKPFSDRQSAIEERWQYEFDMIKDPRTGRIPAGIRDRELALARTLPTREDVRALRGDILNTYTVLGPGNLGGRTRAFAYDKLSASIMLSGGVSSGIFRSTNGGASWTNVTPADEIHNVTALAQDPRTGFESTWYYATGEASGNSASLGAFYFGHGMYKSTDNGLTWSKLTAYNTGTLEGFDSRRDFCHRIAINPTTGHIYAAVTNNIVRSTDGGATWTATPGVLGKSGSFSSAEVTDIICTSTGRLYAAFSGIAGNSTATGTPPSTDLDGVWTSTTGAALSWTKIAGAGSATTPPGWNAAGLYRRVVLALAPSNEDILYVLYDNLVVSDCAGVPAPEADFFKWVQSTSTWTDRSANMPNEPGCSNGNDPFAIQGGYDMAIAVKPDDENFVLIGGTNAYRSTNGFATTAATTRIGGYAGTGGYTDYAGHHPDIHVFRFHPTTPTTMVCGSDGGIHRTTGIAASPVVWTNLNNDYITYQFYHVTLDPTPGSSVAIGGAQDNGTTRTSGTTTHTPLFGGDGVAVGISSGNAFHYVGFQSGGIIRRLSTDLYGFGTDIKPAGSGSGIFVTYFLLDQNNTEVLYYASFGDLYRTASASTVTTGTWTTMTGVGTATTGDIRSMAVTRGPYTATSKLYMGTSDAKIYRLDNPRDAIAATAPVNITGASMPTGSVIVGGIAVDPSDDKKVMVTFSNYGVSSIWYTADASVAIPVWSAVEGTISLPSIRSCAIVTRPAPNPTEYYVGTSVGLFGTTSLSGGTTTWVREGSTSIKYAVVSSLSLRPFDNKFLVGTHGNGMFSTTVVTGVAEASLPTGYALYQNYPNPFNPSTTLSFDLPQSSHVTLEVFDATGRKVADVLNETKQAGRHRVDFGATNLSRQNAGGLASGVYFYKITTNGFSSTKKMLLLR